MKGLYKFFMVDDRTGLPSSSKTVRLLTWLLGVSYVVAGIVSLFNEIEFSDNSVRMMDNIKDFLIFLIPSIEVSYQYNRTAKMKWGNAEIQSNTSTDTYHNMGNVETQTNTSVENYEMYMEEEKTEEEPKRKRVDL